MAEPFLYERVYGHILDEIRRGRLRSGDRVPSEKELAQRFEVSRITSKRALHMLAEAGVLDRRQGKGSFVAEHPPPLASLAGHRSPAGERLGTSPCLGLVLPDASQAYGLDLLCAVEERCADHGYHLIVRRTRDRQDLEEAAVRSLFGGDLVAGLIMFPVHGEFYNASLVRLVLDRSPVVLVDRYLRGIPACAVYTDNAAAARSLTGHLFDRGHDKVAFLSPPVENTSSIEDRISGHAAALAARGLRSSDRLRFTGFRSTLPGAGTPEERAADLDAIRAFVDREPDVTGFVACEYTIAVLLAQVLSTREGWDTGRYLIACFDSPADPLTVPPFLHVRQDQHEMGRRAVDLLIAQLAGEEVPLHSTVPYSLVGEHPAA